MSGIIFIRLLANDNKQEALADVVRSLRDGKPNPLTFTADHDSLDQVPGSPFAYWVTDRIRRLFKVLPPFEGDGRTAKQGLATADDFRFVRTWWEVPTSKIVSGTKETTPTEFRQQTFKSKRWVPLAKGGSYSPFHNDLSLVINWERDGEEIKAWAAPLYGNSGWSRIIKSVDFYFRSGFTWPLRGIRLSTQAVPRGAIFSVAGKLATCDHLDDLLPLLGITNSQVFDFLVRLFAGKVGGVQYEVGLLGRIPLPADLSSPELCRSVLNAYTERASASTQDERSHLFFCPALLQVRDRTLKACLSSWYSLATERERKILEEHKHIDEIVFQLYGIDHGDRYSIEEVYSNAKSAPEEDERDSNTEEDESQIFISTDPKDLTTDLLSYFVGVAVGKWDVRYAIGERQPPKLPDPFAPLPICSPGMLQSPDGLPLTQTLEGYPFSIDWDGILVDDLNHPDDIIRRVRDVLELIWKDSADTIEKEACEILSVKELRDYFRKPSSGGFWGDHVKHYSKSRRKAPIYWLLQSSKKNYALWFYYHRLDKDILFKALLNYVEPKIRLEESRLETLRSQRAEAETSGRGAKKLEKDLDRQEELISELRDFENKIRRVANLHLDPDLNDGVVLNIAPLRELVPWKEAKTYWDELLAGKYEWSSIGKQLREKGVVHGL